ncbi:MFS transporter [Emcibacter sp.]|uniref:MFS transporter n=1 Tax=Emcibacter sp. TaxID=1979954 RepID=UPI003A902F16
MDTSETSQASKPVITTAGKLGILMATALALLASPLVAPIMKDLSVIYADQAEQEALARGILWLIGFLPGEVTVIFLVKFILLSIPALFIMIGAPITGWIVDTLGRKNLLVASLFLFAFAGTSGFFASTFTELFVGRALLGLSVAGIKTSTITMAGDFFRGAERAKFIGAQGSAMKVGGVVFMLLGGYLASIHWSAPFWAYMLALVVVPNILFFLPESKDLKIGHEEPTDPKDLEINYLQASYPFLGAFLGSVFFYLTVVQMSFFLRDAFDMPNFYTGLTIAIANTVSALIALKFSTFRARLNYVHVFAFIFLAMAVGYFILINAPSYTIVVVAMIVSGLGFGLIVPAQSAWIIDVVPPEKRGFGVGLVTTAMFLGQFLSPIVFQPFVDMQDPFSVFRAAAWGLMVLTILYGLIGFLPKLRTS